ncbi:myeloid cell surface antigen CD33-like [Sorex araneus]|uniref:myeloid cell surface antigen CD33-like n=1 Tax=Sorex araneus TaxID=42254 RepID=UPI0024336F85|nr:myeloid cell surface antigen CD33-like [Sorex araneus]
MGQSGCAEVGQADSQMLLRMGPQSRPSAILLLLVLLWPGSQAPYDRFWIDMERNVTVAPRMSFYIPCRVYHPASWKGKPKAKGPRMPVIYSYWFRESTNEKKDKLVAAREGDRQVAEEDKSRFEIIGSPVQNDCSLIIRNPRKQDEGSYFYQLLRITHRYSFKWRPIYIHVSDTFVAPDIFLPATLHPGVPSNLVCSVPWVTAWETSLIILWNSAALATLGPRTNTSSVLTLTPMIKDDGSILSCQVYFPESGLTVQKIVRIQVSCDPNNPEQCYKASGPDPPQRCPLNSPGDGLCPPQRRGDNRDLGEFEVLSPLRADSEALLDVIEGSLVGVTVTILLASLLYFIYCT